MEWGASRLLPAKEQSKTKSAKRVIESEREREINRLLLGCWSFNLVSSSVGHTGRMCNAAHEERVRVCVGSARDCVRAAANRRQIV